MRRRIRDHYVDDRIPRVVEVDAPTIFATKVLIPCHTCCGVAIAVRCSR